MIDDVPFGRVRLLRQRVVRLIKGGDWRVGQDAVGLTDDDHGVLRLGSTPRPRISSTRSWVAPCSTCRPATRVIYSAANRTGVDGGHRSSQGQEYKPKPSRSGVIGIQGCGGTPVTSRSSGRFRRRCSVEPTRLVGGVTGFGWFHSYNGCKVDHLTSKPGFAFGQRNCTNDVVVKGKLNRADLNLSTDGSVTVTLAS
jgi:hypothetical protein